MNLKIINDCELIEKAQLRDSIYYLKYRFVENFEWLPGQYIGITIQNAYRRSYSILDYDGENLSFLVDVKPGGIASLYFQDVQIGDKRQILGPYGKFVLQHTPKKKIFISTGTGIAPIVPMIKKAHEKNFDFEVYFGTKLCADDYAFDFVKEYLTDTNKYHQCVTRENPQNLNAQITTHSGRVTEVLPQQKFDFENCEFYICGGPQMVLDTQNVLQSFGAKNIMIEKY